MSFLKWLRSRQKESCNDLWYCPSLDAKEAIAFLCDYLLGENWVCVGPFSEGQITTEIVYEILLNYSKKFRRELQEERTGKTIKKGIFKWINIW